jgi:acyl-CoA thioester hydrolase
MSHYFKMFEIRWNDLDVNRHLANISYMQYTVHTRMSFLIENGINQNYLKEQNIGPVIIKEEFNYLKEIHGDHIAYCDVELLGHSEDYRFAQFSHSIYNQEKEISAYSIVSFAWIDLNTRKIIKPDSKILSMLNSLAKSEQFRILEKEDTFDVSLPRLKKLKI